MQILEVKLSANLVLSSLSLNNNYNNNNYYIEETLTPPPPPLTQHPLTPKKLNTSGGHNLATCRALNDIAFGVVFPLGSMSYMSNSLI
jgi:hypothetical protein